MPILQMDMLKGRTLEQKRKMVNRVTMAVAESLDIPKERVTIIIREIEQENAGKGGLLRVDN